MTELIRDPWARAEKSLNARERRDAERADRRDEWRRYHLNLADAFARHSASLQKRGIRPEFVGAAPKAGAEGGCG